MLLSKAISSSASHNNLIMQSEFGLSGWRRNEIICDYFTRKNSHQHLRVMKAIHNI